MSAMRDSRAGAILNRYAVVSLKQTATTVHNMRLKLPPINEAPAVVGCVGVDVVISAVVGESSGCFVGVVDSGVVAVGVVDDSAVESEVDMPLTTTTAASTTRDTTKNFIS